MHRCAFFWRNNVRSFIFGSDGGFKSKGHLEKVITRRHLTRQSNVVMRESILVFINSLSLYFQLLHGEHYFQLYRPIPKGAQVHSIIQLADIVNKGKDAVFIFDGKTIITKCHAEAVWVKSSFFFSSLLTTSVCHSWSNASLH